ncbi:hypothetical protein ZYGR_0AK01970 [Zygosaccharomyces rouxii]|uniref:DNA repair protein REV1 n=1 Tax=Zygosaccharomyces rouxii TaxID=4956 RepID=A0A1Q3ADI6_ZYGRO|nr:hypothetical protein ZYGR_0AK01970 [Zygosaccharomyces rouxii]
MSGYDKEDSPLANRGNIPERSFLESLSDDGLLEYITGLSQEQNEQYSRGDYFHDKQRRQDRQDQEFRERYGNGSEIFSGVSIYVNGFTKPGRMQLHEMVVANGGKFVHFLSSKGQVSHIIASNLPLKKRVELANYKICTPEWIVDSIQVGKLLPWQDYALLSDQDEIQPKLQQTTIVSCKDPDFLRQFFSKSRLHHLSNWKSDLRAEFCEKFLEKPLHIPSKNDVVTVFHIDFDCFFASVSAMANGFDIHAEPIVVCHGTKNSDIASCNYEARRYGIRNGMWVGTAERMMPRGKKLIRLGYEFDQFELMSKRFYQILHDSQFQLVLPISIDEAVCIAGDLSHVECDLICQRIRENVSKVTNGCTVSIGCANSLVLARLALKHGKPDGYQIVNCHELDDTFWSHLKIDDLPGVGRSLAYKISEYTYPPIGNLSELRQMELDSLQRCVGEKIGNKIYLAVRGKDDEESGKMIYEPKQFFERKSLSIDINWGIRFDTIYEIDQFIDRCTQYLIDKLKELDKKTSQLTLKIMKRSKDEAIDPPKYLGMGKCDPFARSARLGVPTDESGVIATEIKSAFRSLCCPPRELRGIAIQFNKLEKAVSNQSKLPFVDAKIYQNLPNDVKGEIGQELNRRRITVKATSAKRINSYQEQFIQELPTQIRNEVENEIHITNKAKKTKFDELKEQVAKRQNEKVNAKSHFLGDNTILLPIKFQNQTNFKKIIQLILNWVDGTIRSQGPHQKDLRLFEKYLQRLSDANRLPLVLRICKLISDKLELRSDSFSTCNGFQEWEKVLLQMILPKLNKNKHTFQTVRKLDLDFDA